MERYRQSAVIAFRGPPDSMEVVLVSSRSGKRWVIPKGLVEPDLEPGPSAAKEAFEEAGVRGEVSADAVGHYTYRKWGGTCEVAVYLMRVDAVLDDWPESAWRERVWLSVRRAAERVDQAQLAALLDESPRLVRSISWRSMSQLPLSVTKKRR
jgi:8-oxo-dGTP pyrophosphatase MutT (NUDIX family)